jgi:ADP-ribosyl-[dinitrogen reductase] hydrolase
VPHYYREELETAMTAAKAAGAMIREEFHRKGGPRGSGDHADIDREAEIEIRRILHDFRPCWGYQGEETGRRDAEEGELHTWLVDPNDGTSAFLQGYRESAVSIGLLRDGIPVLGVVYAPMAPDDKGDLFTWADGCGPLQRNDSTVPASSPSEGLGSHDILLVSHKADFRSGQNALMVHPARYIALPSIAYRLALAASGYGRAAVSINSPGGHDYAGGHALLRGAGGEFVDQDGSPVTYSRSGESRTQRCFGGDPRILMELAKRDWKAIYRGEVFSKGDYDLSLPSRKEREVGGEILQRARGCLMGQLAGDALGSLVEFQSTAQIAAKYRHGVRELHNGGTFNTLAGQPTDDSEMALSLARSIVKGGRYDVREAARAYVSWYGSRPFDIGRTTSRALSALAASPQEDPLSISSMAAAAESQANGSLMRISPLGIWGHSLAAGELADYARKDSRLTHPHRLCQDACAVFVVAIARGVRSGEGPQQVFHHALAFADEHACPETAQILANAALGPPEDYEHQMGWVAIALQNAFYQLLHAKSLEEGVVNTVMRGGDTDTNAAIAGALLGAVHGRAAIPEQWQRMLLSCRPIEGLGGVFKPRPRLFWPVDCLYLAEHLLACAEAP